MDITSEIEDIIGNDVSEKLAYKAVLLASKSLARLVCSFANTSGGHIIFGILDNKEVAGLSQDFRANSITHKALDLLSPMPDVHYQYVTYKEKRLYVIKIEKSDDEILFEGNAYIRTGDRTQLKFKTGIKAELKKMIAQNKSKEAMELMLEHFSKTDDNYDTLILCQSRYNRLKEEQLKDIVRSEEFRMEINKIDNSLLELINKMNTIE